MKTNFSDFIPQPQGEKSEKSIRFPLGLRVKRMDFSILKEAVNVELNNMLAILAT
jgi:hypothetical protein